MAQTLIIRYSQQLERYISTVIGDILRHDSSEQKEKKKKKQEVVMESGSELTDRDQQLELIEELSRLSPNLLLTNIHRLQDVLEVNIFFN